MKLRDKLLCDCVIRTVWAVPEHHRQKFSMTQREILRNCGELLRHFESSVKVERNDAICWACMYV